MNEKHLLLPVPRARQASRAAHGPLAPSGPSLFGTLRLRVAAWFIDQEATAEVKVLDARRRVAEARRATEEAEYERELRWVVRRIPHDQACDLLGRMAEIERRLAEIKAIRRHGASAVLPPVAALPGAIVEPQIEDEQLDALAVRAVVNLSHLNPDEAERQWAAWRRGLDWYLPPLAAEEVARKAAALRRLADGHGAVAGGSLGLGDGDGASAPQEKATDYEQGKRWS